MTTAIAPTPNAPASACDGHRPGAPPRRFTGSVLAPLGLLVLVNSIGAATLLPAVRHALAATPAGSHTIETAIWVSAAATPVLGLAMSALVAACLWAALSLTGGDVAWRPLLRVALYAEAAWSLQSVFISAVLHLRGLDTLRQPIDLQVPTGLDVYFDPASPVAVVLAQHLGLFYLAWLGVLTWGVRAAAATSWPRAASAALAPWTIGVVYALIQHGGAR